MIRLGTRGSKLALAQSRLIADALKREGAEIEIAIITTSGDRVPSSPPDVGAIGIFVKELEAKLLAGGIDLAVHSLKDLPTDLLDGLALGAVPVRGPALDALVCRRRGATIDDLPEGARIGTSSPRRGAQLLHHRPDFDMRPVRGNVDTRLRKLDAGEFDAVVLAQAGLERLAVADAQPYVVPPDVCLPAPGQGALAVEIRADDARVAGLVRPLDDATTRACVTAERAFLKALGGGCRAAVGALARVCDGVVRLQGVVAGPDGASLVRGAAEGAMVDATSTGYTLARDLLARGAGPLIEAAR